MTTTITLHESDLHAIIADWANKKFGTPACSIRFYFDRPEHPTPTDQGEGCYVEFEVGVQK